MNLKMTSAHFTEQLQSITEVEAYKIFEETIQPPGILSRFLWWQSIILENNKVESNMMCVLSELKVHPCISVQDQNKTVKRA